MSNKIAVVTGAGGFIGGHLVKRLLTEGYGVRAVDTKPLREWYQIHCRANNLCLDCSREGNCQQICFGADEVYNLAADMGGMGFIESHRVECLRSILINTNLIEAAYKAGVDRYFFSSSACAYNTLFQLDPNVRALTEADAYPALPERGYGWEKLISEIFCQEYWRERGMKTFIARFHNVYGPYGTWYGGREKAPAALCRKFIEAKAKGEELITIWGDGEQTRSFMYIDDCIEGIMRIMRCDKLIGRPVNLGSSELVSITDLANEISEVTDIYMEYGYDPTAPQGVAGRNSDNTFIKSMLNWEPTIPLSRGLRYTFSWIKQEYEKLGNRA